MVAPWPGLDIGYRGGGRMVGAESGPHVGRAAARRAGGGLRKIGGGPLAKTAYASSRGSVPGDGDISKTGQHAGRIHDAATADRSPPHEGWRMENMPADHSGH